MSKLWNFMCVEMGCKMRKSSSKIAYARRWRSQLLLEKVGELIDLFFISFSNRNAFEPSMKRDTLIDTIARSVSSRRTFSENISWEDDAVLFCISIFYQCACATWTHVLTSPRETWVNDLMTQEKKSYGTTVVVKWRRLKKIKSGVKIWLPNKAPVLMSAFAHNAKNCICDIENYTTDAVAVVDLYDLNNSQDYERGI